MATDEAALGPRDTVVLTAGAIAEAVQGRLLSGRPTEAIGGFSIDTRTLTAGDLFFAIRGERFDGHRFVADAFAAGACGAVVADSTAVPASVLSKGRTIVVVEDAIEALQRLARHVRRSSAARVVAVTGSTGKTTTKEVAAALLAARYRVFRNRGNLNNHIGLPLSLLELRHGADVAVVELGMNHAGEIRTLVSIAEPEVRVWTNVSEVHAEFFGSVDAIADAKAEIMENAAAETVLVANANDPRVMARAARFVGRVRTFGIETEADVSAWQVADRGLDGMAATMRLRGKEIGVETALLGRGGLANILAAAAVAAELEVPLEAMVERIAGLHPPAHRGQVLKLPGGITLVDDSYNSNPAALERALEVLAHDQYGARRVAVLGEMLELGQREIALHEACGRAAAAAGVSVLITVGGPPAAALGAAAIAAGLPVTAVVHCANAAQAGQTAISLVRPGDVVLVKGSRGIRTDVVVERLKAEYA